MRERRAARAFDDSWPPLEKLYLTGVRTCVWCVHRVFSRGPHFLPFIRAGMAADGNRALMPLPKQVEEVVYWTNPLVSGGVFLVGLFAFYLVGLCNYSSISVICYVLILNLTVRSSSRVAVVAAGPRQPRLGALTPAVEDGEP